MYFAAYTATVPLAELMNDPDKRFIALELDDVNPFAPLFAVIFPSMVNVPVEALFAPAAVEPAFNVPVIETTPAAPLFTIPTAAVPVTVPLLTVIVPPVLLKMPVPVDAVTFPFGIVIVPVDILYIP
jgi:hypothetical protein